MAKKQEAIIICWSTYDTDYPPINIWKTGRRGMRTKKIDRQKVKKLKEDLKERFPEDIEKIRFFNTKAKLNLKSGNSYVFNDPGLLVVLKDGADSFKFLEASGFSRYPIQHLLHEDIILD